MTGGNRLLVGIGWPLVVILFWFKTRRPLKLSRGVGLELVFLGAATAYSFLIFFQKQIALWDAAVLIGIFALYIWLSSRAESEEPELIGPSAALGSLSKTPRRIAVFGLFIYSAAVILASAEPFALSLLDVGTSLNVNKFVLVQWVAPLASESPEIIIAAIFTLQGNGAAAMMTLISAKVNQWTLLVGCIPVVYSISLGEASSLHLDSQQTEEILLTAAQSLFAVVLLLRLRIGWLGALTLFVLFSTQLVLYDVSLWSIHVRVLCSYVYLGLAAALLVVDRQRIILFGHMTRDVFSMFLGRSNP
jgi:cation:H+ antiporter